MRSCSLSPFYVRPFSTKLALFKTLQKVRFYCQKQSPRGVNKGILKNFAKFTGKHLCQGLFFNKVAGPRTDKVRLWQETGVFL